MCIIFINILSTVSFNIFIGTVKQIVKFISYLTTVTNSLQNLARWDDVYIYQHLSTVSFDIFIGTVKQIVKFISYLTTVTNSQKQRRATKQQKKGGGGGRDIRAKKKKKPKSQCVSNCPAWQAT